MIARGRLTLTVEAGALDDVVERFAEGPVIVYLESLTVEAEGELLRHDLRLRSVADVNIAFVAREDIPEERTGPLVRVYATRPDEEA